MNSHQKMALRRQARRFTRGDGIVICEGPFKGREGQIVAVGDCKDGQETTQTYHVQLQATALSTAESTAVTSAQLESAPALNTGKYGGPTRGGRAGGWCGGNSYRALSPSRPRSA